MLILYALVVLDVRLYVYKGMQQKILFLKYKYKNAIINKRNASGLYLKYNCET
jgi:hypothetical protein